MDEASGDWIGKADTRVSDQTHLLRICNTIFAANEAINGIREPSQGSRGGFNTIFHAVPGGYSDEVKGLAARLAREANPMYVHEGRMNYTQLRRTLERLKDVPVLKAYAEDPNRVNNPDSFYIAEKDEFILAPSHPTAPAGYRFVFDGLLKSLRDEPTQWRALIKGRMLAASDRKLGFGTPG